MAKKKDDGKWITIQHTPVHLDESGRIDKGPAAIEGAKPSELSSRSMSEDKRKKPKTPKVGGLGASVNKIFVPDSKVRKWDDKVPAPLKKQSKEIGSLHEGMIERVRFAFSGYTGGGYGSLNRAIREGKPLPTPEAIRTAAVFDYLFRHYGTLSKPLVTYRGITGSPSEAMQNLEDAKAALASGELITFTGYTSTSIDPGIASGFATGISMDVVPENNTPIMLEIVTSKGLYAEEYTDYDNEQELILDRSSKFRVVGVKKLRYDNFDGGFDEYDTIQLELVP